MGFVQSLTRDPHPGAGKAVGLALVLAICLASTVGMLAANYRIDDDVQATSLGGDFLQDWIGGHVIASGRASRLYDGNLTDRLQHDADLVGFHWKDSAYFPMVYPPAWYLATAPLSQLPYPIACFVWLALLALTLPVSVWILCRFLNFPAHVAAGWVVGLILFPPVLQSVVLGQKSLIWLLVWVAVIAAYQSRSERLAGAIFGTMILKPTLVPVVIVMMIAKRRWGFLIASAASALVIVAVSLLVVPAATWIDYLGVIAGAGRYHESAGYSTALAQNLGSLLLPIGERSRILYWLLYGITAGLLVVVLTRIVRRPGVDDQQYRFWSVAVLGTILLSPHFFAYDLTLLAIIPVVAVNAGKCRLLAPWMLACYVASASNVTIVDAVGIPAMPIILICLLVWHDEACMSGLRSRPNVAASPNP